MALAARTITVALDMSTAFDTINIHTLIRNHTSIQRQFKTSVPLGGVLSPTLFNIYTTTQSTGSGHVLPYDITITSTHTQVRVHPKNTHNPYYRTILVSYFFFKNPTLSYFFVLVSRVLFQNSVTYC